MASLTRPAVSLSAAADVIAGYVVAAPATPRPVETLLTVPLLFVGAALLHAAGDVFSACFTVESGPSDSERAGSPGVALARAIRKKQTTLKAAFLTGAAMALAGLFAAMAPCLLNGLSAGHLPVYAAGFVFLVGWARAGRTSQSPVVGPASAGLLRAMTLAIGMSAHGEIVYGHGGASLWRPAAAPLVAAGLYFAYGALAETLEQSEGEGGRRYTIMAAFVGMLAVLGGAAALFAKTSPARSVILAGAVLLVARSLPALRTLVPGAVRRFAEAARLSGLFMAAALAWGRWPTQGTVLVLGAAALALVLPCAVLFAREETVPVPASLRQRDII